MGKLIETKTEYRELIIMRAGWQADKESERERERENWGAQREDYVISNNSESKQILSKTIINC